MIFIAIYAPCHSIAQYCATIIPLLCTTGTIHNKFITLAFHKDEACGIHSLLAKPLRVPQAPRIAYRIRASCQLQLFIFVLSTTGRLATGRAGDLQREIFSHFLSLFSLCLDADGLRAAPRRYGAIQLRYKTDLIPKCASTQISCTARPGLFRFKGRHSSQKQTSSTLTASRLRPPDASRLRSCVGGSLRQSTGLYRCETRPV